MNINMMITTIPDTNNYHDIYGITFVMSQVDPVWFIEWGGMCCCFCYCYYSFELSSL